MLELESALERILAIVPPPTSESVKLTAASGRVLTENIASPLDLPPFDNSAMDGYAVRAHDVAGATAANPVRLRLHGRLAAGENSPNSIQSGECARIFTGAPIPGGADTVVMQEDTRVEGDEVLILDAVRSGENVRWHGEDVRKGSLLASAGTEISVGLLGLLAATGLETVSVACRPKVSVLATGTELRSAGEPLASGQIYECNRAMLAALIERAGGIPQVQPLVRDSLAETRAALESAFASSDIVVTSGGVSVGEMDFVKAAFEALGGHMEFWKVAIRPGKPFVFGRLNTKFLFGLPGNPVSAFVTFLLLVRPALRRWQGLAEVGLPRTQAVLGEAIANPGERLHFMRVRLSADGKIFSSGKQASHALSSLAAANALIAVPPKTQWVAGQTVTALTGF